jgi:D-tagatose-1,6-bisphosphate aldolase subunit GatZ/KbaZ
MSTSFLTEVVRAQATGQTRGTWAACSSNRFVLDAVMRQGRADSSPVLIESTSSQVNPEGGYSGRTPAEFAAFLGQLADEAGLPRDALLLGADHLGPHPYRAAPAALAMDRARELVRQCVLAGYGKLHLDCSMRLGGDPGPSDAPLGMGTITERTAELCAAAESAYSRLPAGSAPPLYVIGTDVPPPGGGTKSGDPPIVTAAREAARTVEETRAAFLRRGLAAAWDRVVAVVVQPGVDFADGVVHDYERRRASELTALRASAGSFVYEAHSTDYQAPSALRALVEDGFAILKVGPALSFAFREAVLALEAIEREWLSERKGCALSGIRAALEAAMLGQPEHWSDHYRGDEADRRLARLFSYSDRVRYYWPRHEVQLALERLIANLSGPVIPAGLVSQYLPTQHAAGRAGEISCTPASLIRHKIQEVTRSYSLACDPRRSSHRPAKAAAPSGRVPEAS